MTSIDQRKNIYNHETRVIVTRTKARILESFQTRKLTGNNGNVRHNGMEKNGLGALGNENVVSFSSNKGGGGGGGGVTLDGGVFR